MIDEHDLSLERLVSGAALDVCALTIDGRCEILDFLRSCAREAPGTYFDLRNILLYASEQGMRTPQRWLKKLQAFDDLWEVRKTDHRLLGFVVDRTLILCLHRTKQRQSLDRQDYERVMRLRKEWLDRYE